MAKSFNEALTGVTSQWINLKSRNPEALSTIRSKIADESRKLTSAYLQTLNIQASGEETDSAKSSDSKDHSSGAHQSRISDSKSNAVSVRALAFSDTALNLFKTSNF